MCISYIQPMIKTHPDVRDIWQLWQMQCGPDVSQIGHRFGLGHIWPDSPSLLAQTRTKEHLCQTFIAVRYQKYSADSITIIFYSCIIQLFFSELMFSDT